MRAVQHEGYDRQTHSGHVPLEAALARNPQKMVKLAASS